MIAGHHESLTRAIPEREREHAPQVVDQVIAILLVQGDDDFAIAVGEKPIAVSVELAPQLWIVVDLAVADEPDRSGCIAQRLRAAGNIDDREASMPQAHRAIVIDALAIGAAMLQTVEHRACIVMTCSFGGENSDNPTHG